MRFGRSKQADRPSRKGERCVRSPFTNKVNHVFRVINDEFFLTSRY